ncbi:MAG: glycosyltransferase family 2 protein [Bacteroidales bacterium]|nr:glycosyltransferase family 2 protein [Bacteroidales bacterium]
MNEKNYTIIIPHKNLPNLLQRCLDSIPRRDDIEIIIVDDNSDPEIVDFDTFPGKDRNGVKIIFDKCGRGAGAARNIGIRNASGKWLLFADCDDYYTEDIDKFLNEYQNSSYDVVYFKCNVLSNGSKKRVISRMNIFIDNYIQKKKGLDDVRYGAWEPWNKLIRREVVRDNNIQFDEISSANDKMFSLLLGYYAENIQVSDLVIYNYVLRPGSIIHSGRNRFDNSFDTIIRQNELYHKINYKRKIPILLFLLRNHPSVNSKVLQRYCVYLKNNRANPFEGFYKNLLFLLRTRVFGSSH